jgi:hypothetical protein
VLESRFDSGLNKLSFLVLVSIAAQDALVIPNIVTLASLRYEIDFGTGMTLGSSTKIAKADARKDYMSSMVRSDAGCNYHLLTCLLIASCR